MNKKMILAALLMVNVCGSIVALNEEPRAILYALDDLGQNLSSVSMIAENIDMYIGMLQMNMRIIKAQLKKANDETKKALWNGAMMVVGAACLRTLTIRAVSKSKNTIDNLTPIFLKFFCRSVVITRPALVAND